MTEGHCNKCRTKREIIVDRIEEINTSRGKRKITYGRCPVCNTKMSRIDGIAKFDNPKINKLQEKINLEKEKELKKMEDEKIQKQKEIDEQKISEFLEKSKENPIIQRNKDIIEIVDKSEKKVVSKSYYALGIVFLIIWSIIALIFAYRTYYSGDFIPNYNSTCSVNLSCGDNINSCPTCLSNNCPACNNNCPNVNCGDVYVNGSG